MSKSLARRIRKLPGGDVELSCPVLGPDEFVISALKEQVHRHGDRQRSGGRALAADTVVRGVFESLSLDPASASKRGRTSAIARGRALASWLWVERLGRSQAEMADALNVSAAAVTMMVGKLRRQGLAKGEEKHLDKVLKTLIEKSDDNTADEEREMIEPKVIILKRQRR